MRKLIQELTAVILIVLASGYVPLSQTAKAAESIHESDAESIRGLEKASRLRELALLAYYYDEVLTQSARKSGFSRSTLSLNLNLMCQKFHLMHLHI